VSDHRYISVLLLFLLQVLCCQRTNPVANLAVLETSIVSEVTDSTAFSGGLISSNGGSTITARGVMWDTNAAFISPERSSDGTGGGGFSSKLTDLFPNTTYYVRAYAINAAGTAYGNMMKFTTPPSQSNYTVSTVAGDTSGTGIIYANFSSPLSVAVDQAGNRFVADKGNQAIWKIGIDGTAVVLAHTDATPHDIVLDSLGNVYVSESSPKILKITPGGVVSTFAGGATAGHVDGTGTEARFLLPFNMDIDAAGNLYVSDWTVYRKISPRG
jgi:hypothetical protein